MIHPETIKHNEHFLQQWKFDSNEKNSRIFFALSQEEEGKIHVYNIEIEPVILIRNLENTLKALKEKFNIRK